MRKKWSLILVAIILVTAIIAYVKPVSSSHQITDKITIATAKTPLSAPILIAQNNHYFQSCGLDVNILPASGGRRAYEAVIQKKADMATSSDSVVAYHATLGEHFSVLASIASSENDVKIISRVRDISESKTPLTAGYWGNTSSEHLMQTLLQLTPNTDHVSTVSNSPELLSKAFLNNELDLISLWEPYIWKIVQKSPKEDVFYFLSTSGFHDLHFMLIASSDLNQKPRIIEKTMAALYLAIVEIHSKPEKVKATFINNLDLDRDFIEWVWDDYLFQLRNANSLGYVLLSNKKWLTDTPITEKTYFDPYLKMAAKLPRFDTLARKWCNNI